MANDYKQLMELNLVPPSTSKDKIAEFTRDTGLTREDLKIVVDNIFYNAAKDLMKDLEE